MAGLERSTHLPRSRVSVVLSTLDRWTAHPLLTVTILVADLAWVAFSVTVGFPARFETIFQTLVAASTLAMVFVIQHTQARQQAATQRKLDEILRALPEADTSMLALEHASDDEIHAARQSQHAVREAAVHTPEDQPST